MDAAGVTSGDKPKRRPRRAGTLRLRSSGLWEARVVLGHYEGRQIRRSFYGRSAIEAEARAQSYAASFRHVSRQSKVRAGVTPTVRFRVLKRCGFACTYCGRRAPVVELHVDHIVPVAQGGTDKDENLTAACAECNLGKGST